MVAILQKTLSVTVYWMKMFEFSFKFYLISSWEVQLTISRHWYKYWLGVEEGTSCYPIQCWPRSVKPYGVSWPQWVKQAAVSRKIKPSSVQKICHLVRHFVWCFVIKLAVIVIQNHRLTKTFWGKHIAVSIVHVDNWAMLGIQEWFRHLQDDEVLNSLASGRSGCNLELVISKLRYLDHFLCNFLRWVPKYLAND